MSDSRESYRREIEQTRRKLKRLRQAEERAWAFEVAVSFALVAVAGCALGVFVSLFI